ncbi:hypothetical protein Zmor_001489 [Zophobas morio]|uniref:Uncharacterized protein n=1 Tax=Zophobas morio TaxID=2755281 RepID=A0AA38IYJ2_9CUCU|nr:hypothetical protein Zmor_001489 [Zophobas morio]
MCISGVCKKVGCDGEIDSNAVEDICGVCNGDGTQCKVVEKVYNERGRDYVKVATIPVGSRNVLIEELAPSMNTIAISDVSGSRFFLNGNHREELNGDKKFGEIEGVYSHPEPKKEKLVIHGPLTEDLVFFCFNQWSLSLDEGSPVDIIYLDFAKAFDRVPDHRLFYELE